MISLRKIADALGYSIATVSMALRNDSSIPVETRKRIKAKAKELGYTPNPLFSRMMSNLHKHQYHETMAYVTMHGTADFWRRFHAHRDFFDSAVQRAQSCGFSLEHMWLGSVDWNFEKLLKVLQSRGIRSIILPSAPRAFEKAINLDEFVSTTVGWKMESPRLSSAETDYTDAIEQALFELEGLGHHKIGLALNHEADSLCSFRFSGRYLAYQQRLILKWRCSPFLPNNEKGWNQADFTVWLKDQRPSALICQADEVPRWVQEAGFSVPRDLSLVHLDWEGTMREWAGVNQNNPLVGSAVIDLMAGQLFQNELGVPVHPQSIMVKTSWVPGPSAGPVRTVKIPAKRN